MAVSDGAASTAAGIGARPTRYQIWLGPLALVTGLAFLTVAFLLGRSELRYGTEGLATQATIVRLWVAEGETSDGDTTYSYHAGYEFMDPATGRTFKGSGSVGELRYLLLRIGDTIDVSFLASDPTENRLGTPEPQLLLPATLATFGGLAIVVAPIVFVSSTRERRMRRTAATASGSADEARRTDVFTRSPVSAAGGLLGMGFGVAFLGLAAFGVTQAWNMPSLLVLTLFGTVVGIAFLAAGVTALRRGFGLKLAEVGPDGLWLLGLGRVAWTDLAEVRIEATHRAAYTDDDGHHVPATTTNSRLGVVPRNPALLARRPDGLSRFLGREFFGLLNRLRPGGRSYVRVVTVSDQSPYGIAAGEMDQSFDDLVASVGRFVTVATRQVQAMGDNVIEPQVSPPLPSEEVPPMTDAELAEVDALLARHGRGTTFVDGD